MKKYSNVKDSKRIMDKISRGEKSYKKIKEEIRPYLKPKKIKQYSTTGKWNVHSISNEFE